MRWRLVVWLGMVGCAPAGERPPAAPAQPTVTVARMMQEYGDYTALVQVQNPTGTHFSVVGIKCAFFQGNQVLMDRGSVVTNLAPGATAYEKVSGGKSPVDRAECRISSATP